MSCWNSILEGSAGARPPVPWFSVIVANPPPGVLCRDPWHLRAHDGNLLEGSPVWVWREIHAGGRLGAPWPAVSTAEDASLGHSSLGGGSIITHHVVGQKSASVASRLQSGHDTHSRRGLAEMPRVSETPGDAADPSITEPPKLWGDMEKSRARPKNEHMTHLVSSKEGHSFEQVKGEGGSAASGPRGRWPRGDPD